MGRSACLLALFAVGVAAAPAGAHAPPGIESVAPPGAPPPRTLGGGRVRLDEVQGLLAAAHLDGWLLYDDHGLDPQAVDLLRPRGGVTGRWFCLIPASGDPVALVSRRDSDAFDAVPARKTTYVTWRDLEAGVRALLKGRRRVALSYSPRGELPAAGRVDAGTVELVRAAGVTVVPSGALTATVYGRWSETQRATHLYAARKLESIKEEALGDLARRLGAGERVTELDVQQRLQRALYDAGLESQTPPLVAAGAHTAAPGYTPTPQRSSEIRRGELLVLTLLARQAGVPGAVYAELAYTAFVGDAVPLALEPTWTAVREARDRAVALLKERRAARSALLGYEVDDAVRAALDKAAVPGAERLAPTGHTLGERAGGDGARLDDLETHDDRPLVPRSGVVVAPSLSVRGEYGMKSGVDVYLGDAGIELTVEKPQRTIDLVRVAAPRH